MTPIILSCCFLFISLTSQADLIPNDSQITNTQISFRSKVGLAAIPKNWQDDDQAWLSVMSKAKELDVDMLGGCNITWTEEYEPSPGVYNWGPMERFFEVMEKNGFDFDVSCDFSGAFFQDQIQAPAHVKFSSFKDPIFFNAYKSFLISFLDKFGSKIDYLVTHAEGSYNQFETYPERLDDYIPFLKQVGSIIREHSPHIQVGINTDPHNKDSLLERYAEVVDFVGYDIGFADEGFLDHPKDLEDVVKRLIDLAKGKRIAFQNIGWCTDPQNDQSETLQTEFIKEIYRILEKYHVDIEYASFYTLFDDDLEFMSKVYYAMFPDYPNDFVDQIVNSLSHCGVFRSDDTPKPGWEELKKQVRKYTK